MVKTLPANAGDARDRGSLAGSGRSWRNKWQSAPVFLPGKLHGQRSLAGYRPLSCSVTTVHRVAKELDTTE